MEAYINNLKKELFAYAKKVENEYNSNKTINKYRIKYLIVVNIYNNILSLNDEKSIRQYLEDIRKRSIKTQELYNALLDKYNREKDLNQKNVFAHELNEHASRLNAYNESFNIIKKHLDSIKKTSTNKPLNESESNKKTTTLINDDTLTSDKIIELLEKYNGLDKNTTEAKRILEEIYKLRVNRENQFKKVYGENYRAYISEIESIENTIAMSVSEGFKEKTLDKQGFLQELRNTINAINEYHFISELQIKKYYKNNNSLSDGDNKSKFSKKYNNYLRKYHVLISSLFKSRSIDFKVDDDIISTEDLIAYLATCNLDGDFSVYKSKFNEMQIGTENTNKKKYIETLTFLNKCINSLCELVNNNFKGNTITIIDKEPTKSDYIEERNKKLREIYLMNQMSRTNSRGPKL